MHTNVCGDDSSQVCPNFKVNGFGIFSLFGKVEFSNSVASWFNFMFLAVVVQIAQGDEVEEFLVFLTVPGYFISFAYMKFIMIIYPFSNAWILTWSLKVAMMR
jgi:hypothetical protein